MTPKIFAPRYAVDENGFLISPEDWNEDFAIANATSAGIKDGLTDEHWTVIRFIRQQQNARTHQLPRRRHSCGHHRLQFLPLLFRQRHPITLLHHTLPGKIDLP